MSEYNENREQDERVLELGDSKSEQGQPAESEPVPTEPVNTETVNREPVYTEPIYTEPVKKDSMNREASYRSSYDEGNAPGGSGRPESEYGQEEPSHADVKTQEDGTYSYSHRRAMENPDEYRIPSYMRDEVGKTPKREQKPFEFKLRAANSSDSKKDESNREPRRDYQDYREEKPQSDNRYNYGSQEPRREEPRQNRYGYEQSGNQERTEYSGNSGRKPKKGNKKTIGLVIAGAAAIGLLIGAGCWSVGNLISNRVSGTAELPDNALEGLLQGAEGGENTGDGFLPDLSVGGDSQDAQKAEEPSIPTAPSAELGAGVVVTDVSDVVDLCMPSVVSITTKATYEYYRNYGYSPFFEYFYGGGSQSPETYEVEGAGSGIIIGDDGEELWIVTNNHVVEDSDEVTVSFHDEATVSAYIKGTDPSNDLAVVGVKLADIDAKTKEGIYAIRMGDSENLRLGESVIAIGNALGIGQSVTTGVVSALNREITTSEKTTLTTIQTDAAINPGNSGGALLNSKGELIGINVAKSSESNTEGMGFAIPISVAKDIIDKLTTMEPKVAVSADQFPYLGVQLKDMDATVAAAYGIPMGVLVYSVEEKSPAAKGGMLVQDVITAFNGIPVSTYADVMGEMQYYAGGTEITVTVQRLENGQYVEKELKIALGLKSDYVTEEPEDQAPTQETPAENNGGRGIEDLIPGFGR